MAATAAGLKALFPSFAGVDDAFITLHLGVASRRLDAGVWGARLDDATYYLAAHMCALDPAGNNAELVAKGESDGYDSTTYGKHFKSMRREVTSGFRVT